MSEIGEARTGEMPRGVLLGYVAAVSTPTRVRVVSSRVIFWFGMASAAVSMLLAIVVVQWIYVRASLWAGWLGGRPTWRDFVRVAKSDNGIVQLIFPGAYFLLAAFFWVLVIPVRRGWPRACRISAVLAGVLVGPLSLAILMVSTSAMVSGMGMAGHRDLMDLWWTLLLIPLPFMLLICRDICVFLGWIARNPIAERDAALFVARPQKELK